MLRSGGDHSGLVDWYVGIAGSLLAELLLACVDRQRPAWVDALVEALQIVVDFLLGNLGKTIHDVVVEIANFNIVEALVGVVEFGDDEWLKSRCSNVDNDSLGVGPSFTEASIDGMLCARLFAFCGCCAHDDGGVRR